MSRHFWKRSRIIRLIISAATTLRLAGIGAVALSFQVSCTQHPERARPEGYERVLDEVAGIDLFRFPTPDPTGSTLAYIHRGEKGRELCVLDLGTMRRKAIRLTNEVTRIRGWSPDGRYLAFVQSPFSLPKPSTSPVAGNEKESWLTLYDRQDDACKRLTDDPAVIESYFAWLTTNRFLLSRRSLSADAWEVLEGRLGGGGWRKVSEKKEFTLLSEQAVAFVEKGELFRQELGLGSGSEGNQKEERGGARQQLSQFEGRGFDDIRWLNYSPEKNELLFCARPADSTWRYLYQFKPDTGRLDQLNAEDTYNGQWIEQGTGFAYVGNPSNHFYLAIRPRDRAGWTNLFSDGSLDHYAVSPDGNRIYAVASVGVEPQGIWEYNLTERILRRVVDGVGSPFVATRLVAPTEYRVKSFDGLEIPCFLFQPVRAKEGGFSGSGSSTSKPQPGKRPAVIYLPPPTLQFQRAFHAEAQLFANLGFYFLAVNFRGCDGYGRDYGRLKDSSAQVRDVLAAHRELAKRPDVDARRIFLYGVCGGVATLTELLAQAPGLWRGAAIRHGVGASFDALDPRTLPAILLTIGDHDVTPGWREQFERWARSPQVDAVLMVHPNSDHNGYNYKATEQREALARISKFFIDHLK